MFDKSETVHRTMRHATPGVPMNAPHHAHRIRLSPQRRALLLAPFAAVVGARAVAADCPEAGHRNFGNMVGLVVKFSQGQQVSDLEMLLELKVRWVRDAVWWPNVEPARGQFVAFSPEFLNQLAFYRNNDIGLVALLTLSNERAYPGGGAVPYDPQAFGRFAAQVARMLRAAGVRFVLEIGNEPHNSALATALGGAWNGYPPSPWVGHYVRMVRAAVKQVKAFDPKIKLLSDEDMWVLHYWFLEEGLPPALDGFAVHPYTPGVPEIAAVAHDTEWTQPFSVVDPDRSFGSAVRRLRAQGLGKFGRAPEVWITEWGWPVGGIDAPRAVSNVTLIAYLPRAYILAAAAGVEVMCWFSANDSVDGMMGLTRNDGTRRDSYLAFKTLTAQLGDHRLVRQVAGLQTLTSGLQAFLFEGPRGRKLVAWSVDAKPRHLQLPAGSPWDSAVDALGRVRLQHQALTVTVYAWPVYVLADWSDANLAASLAAVA